MPFHVGSFYHMKCFNCPKHLRTQYREREPFARTQRAYCPGCERSDVYTTIRMPLVELKAALAYYYEAAKSEKDSRRNPYINRKRYKRIYDEKILPKFTEDVHTVDGLLEKEGIKNEVY